MREGYYVYRNCEKPGYWRSSQNESHQLVYSIKNGYIIRVR